MDAIEAVQKAVKHSAKIRAALKQEMSGMITEDFLTEDFWMDRITPETFFVSEKHLIGFVYSIIYNYAFKD